MNLLNYLILEQKEFEKLIFDHWIFIKSCCGKFSSGDPDKRDLLFSAALEKIWCNADKFTFSADCNFKGWVYRVVHNEFVNIYRREKKKETLSLGDVYTGSMEFKTCENVDSKIRLDDIIHTANKKFKGKMFQVFHFHLLNGYTMDEVSKMINVPMGSVKNITFRIRKFLSEEKNIIRS